MFLLSQIIPIYVVSYQIKISIAIVIFTAFFLFNLYAITKCLTTYSDIDLQFSDSFCLFIILKFCAFLPFHFR